MKNKTTKMQVFILLLFIAIGISSYILTRTKQDSDLLTVKSVDIEKYMGKWYDIASFPQRFQKGCYNTTATYTLSPKGHVIVENACNKNSLDGKVSGIKGKAFVVKNSGNAKLKVQFFWPFKADYWIIDLADDYSYAVVSEPTKNYLWILSRTPEMDSTVYENILLKLVFKGFDVAKLQKVTHKLPNN